MLLRLITEPLLFVLAAAPAMAELVPLGRGQRVDAGAIDLQRFTSE